MGGPSLSSPSVKLKDELLDDNFHRHPNYNYLHFILCVRHTVAEQHVHREIGSDGTYVYS